MSSWRLLHFSIAVLFNTLFNDRFFDPETFEKYFLSVKFFVFLSRIISVFFVIVIFKLLCLSLVYLNYNITTLLILVKTYFNKKELILLLFKMPVFITP